MSRRIVALFAIVLMVLSSTVVIASMEGAGASNDCVSVKDLVGSTEYWITAEKNDSTYTISQGTGSKDCVVKIDAYTETNGRITVKDGCGFVIERNEIMLIKSTIVLNGGTIDCYGCLQYYRNGSIEFIKDSEAVLKVEIGGDVKQYSEEEFICGDSIIYIANLYATKGCIEISAPKGDFDLVFVNSNNAPNSLLITSLIDSKVKFDCNVKGIGVRDMNNSTIYLRNDVCCELLMKECTTMEVLKSIRPINTGFVYAYTDCGADYVGYKINEKMEITTGNIISFDNSNETVSAAKTLVYVDKGEVVNLNKLFDTKTMDGYKITSWKCIRNEMEDYVKIKDPTNFKCDHSYTIDVDCELMVNEKDYTAFAITTVVLSVLALLSLVAVWFLNRKYDGGDVSE